MGDYFEEQAEKEQQERKDDNAKRIEDAGKEVDKKLREIRDKTAKKMKELEDEVNEQCRKDTGKECDISLSPKYSISGEGGEDGLEGYIEALDDYDNSLQSSSTIPRDFNSNGYWASGMIDDYAYFMDNDIGVNNDYDFFSNLHTEFEVSDAKSSTFNNRLSNRFSDITYYNEDGFHGLYNLSNGNAGIITSDVSLTLDLNGNSHNVTNLQIGKNNPISIDGYGSIGTITYETSSINDGFALLSNDRTNDWHTSAAFIVFSDQYTSENNPERVAGFVSGQFYDKNYTSTDPNNLKGIFVADVKE